MHGAPARTLAYKQLPRTPCHNAPGFFLLYVPQGCCLSPFWVNTSLLSSPPSSSSTPCRNTSPHPSPRHRVLPTPGRARGGGARTAHRRPGSLTSRIARSQRVLRHIQDDLGLKPPKRLKIHTTCRLDLFGQASFISGSRLPHSYRVRASPIFLFSTRTQRGGVLRSEPNSAALQIKKRGYLNQVECWCRSPEFGVLVSHLPESPAHE